MAVDSAGRVLDFGAARLLHPEGHLFPPDAHRPAEPAVEPELGVWRHKGPGTAGCGWSPGILTAGLVDSVGSGRWDAAGQGAGSAAVVQPSM